MGVGTKAVATAAAAAGGLLPTDDAEAGIIFKGARTARDFAERVIGDLKAPNIIPGINRKTGLTEKQAFDRMLVDLKDMADKGNMAKWAKTKPPFFDDLPPRAKENWSQMSVGQRIGTMNTQRERRIASHMHTYLDYNKFAPRMLEKEGGANGAGYLTGLDIAYEEMLERIPDAFQKDLEKYSRFRMGNGFVGRPQEATKRGVKDLKGEGLRDRAYYERLHGGKIFQHGATQEPKETAKQLMERTHREEAAKRAAAEEAARKQEIADEINAVSETKGEPAKAPTGKPEVDRANLKKGLLASTVGAGVVDPDDADSAMLPSDGIFGYPQQGSTVDAGVGPTAVERLTQPYVDDRIHRENQAEIMAPHSDTLQQITMGARGLERRLEGSPMGLLFPEGAINYLETINRPNEDPNWATRVFGILDFMP